MSEGWKMRTRRWWWWYRENHRFVDSLLLLLVSGVLIGAWWSGVLTTKAHLPSSIRLYATIAGLSVTLLGFGVTALTLLVSLLKDEEFQELRERDDYPALFTDFKFALFALAVNAVVALVALALATVGIGCFVVTPIMLALTAWAAIAMGHAASILLKAVDIHAKAEQEL